MVPPGNEDNTAVETVEPAESLNHRPFERRHFRRYPASGDVQLETDEWYIDGKLVDESIGGIGVDILDDSDLWVDQELTVNFGEIPMQGRIRHMRKNEDGTFRLGIGWIEQEKAIAARAGWSGKETAQFYCHGGLLVVCRNVKNFADKAYGTLWNGASFKMDPDLVYSRTFAARESELETLGSKLELLKQLYGLKEQPSPKDLAWAIVQFEFTDWHDLD